MLDTGLGRFFVISGIAIPVIFIGLLFYALTRGDPPIVLSYADFLSPDQRWVATEEYIDNGMGFGMGARYHEIHLRPPKQVLIGHGEREKSSVFYVEAPDNDNPPKLTWIDASHLQITLTSSQSPGKNVIYYRGVNISYQ